MKSTWGTSGDKKRYLGMVPRLLTDARETSYWIFRSLLTAECSTVELPGIRATLSFSLYYSKLIHAMTFRREPGALTGLRCAPSVASWSLLCTCRHFFKPGLFGFRCIRSNERRSTLCDTLLVRLIHRLCCAVPLV